MRGRVKPLRMNWTKAACVGMFPGRRLFAFQGESAVEKCVAEQTRLEIRGNCCFDGVHHVLIGE